MVPFPYREQKSGTGILSLIRTIKRHTDSKMERPHRERISEMVQISDEGALLIIMTCKQCQRCLFRNSRYG